MSGVGMRASSFTKFLDIRLGYIVAILGISGTGKSMSALELLRSRSEACLLITTSENIEYTKNSLSVSVILRKIGLS
ncbi:MAG: hypothetical protein ACOC3C_07345 [Candidatus Thorarchaeota archaeon]